MKTMQLTFNKEGIDLQEEINSLTMQELTFRVIRNIILAYAGQKRGLDEEERRKFYKICNAFEEAVKPGDNGQLITEIELEDDWMGFIRKCKREVTLMPDKVLEQVERLLEAVKDR